MSSYVRKCSLELLAYYYSNTDFEEEFQSILKLLQEPESIQILINLARDEILSEIIYSIDEKVKLRLLRDYDGNENPSESIFEDVINEELATKFLYRLVNLS